MNSCIKYSGLTDGEVLRSRAQYGANILSPSKKVSLWRKFFGKFNDALIRILLVAGVLSAVIAGYDYWGLGHSWTVFFEPMGIFVAIILATGLSFYFELIADKEFAILNQDKDFFEITAQQSIITSSILENAHRK